MYLLYIAKSVTTRCCENFYSMSQKSAMYWMYIAELVATRFCENVYNILKSQLCTDCIQWSKSDTDFKKNSKKKSAPSSGTRSAKCLHKFCSPSAPIEFRTCSVASRLAWVCVWKYTHICVCTCIFIEMKVYLYRCVCIHAYMGEEKIIGAACVWV